LDFSPTPLATPGLVFGGNEHRAQNPAVGENSKAIFLGKFANERFAMFIVDGGPNTLQLLGPHKTLPLAFERRFDSLNEGVHGFCAIVPDRKIPSIGIILINGDRLSSLGRRSRRPGFSSVEKARCSSQNKRRHWDRAILADPICPG
jgi:hypothetical protein